MTPSELIAELSALGPASLDPGLLHTRLLLRYLADHVYEATLSNGGKLRDGLDFRHWLVELAEEARNLDRTKVSNVGEKSTGPKVTNGPASQVALAHSAYLKPPAPQPRWNDSTCPRCGHVHEGVGECGVSMGKDRICRCELEVSA